MNENVSPHDLNFCKYRKIGPNLKNFLCCLKTNIGEKLLSELLKQKNFNLFIDYFLSLNLECFEQYKFQVVSRKIFSFEILEDACDSFHMIFNLSISFIALDIRSFESIG